MDIAIPDIDWSKLTPYLDDLEARIDPDGEEEVLAQWRRFLADDWPDPVFVPTRAVINPPTIEWPEVNINHALDSFELMLLDQFHLASKIIADPFGQIPTVRSNYGTAIMPTLFGAELFIMDETANTLPASHAINGGGLEAIEKLLEASAPRLTAGLGNKVFQCGALFLQVFERYPKIGQYVHLIHPDLQGPMDVCEMLWGSDLFMDVYDEEEVVHAMLDRVTETYIAFMKDWRALVPPRADGTSAHWHWLIRGNIMLREDSAMNFSPEMFDTFIRPYSQRCLDACGGGVMHFCGKGDHFIASAAQMDNLHGFNLGQSDMNDAETVFTNTIDQGKRLWGFHRGRIDELLAAGRPLHGRIFTAPAES